MCYIFFLFYLCRVIFDTVIPEIMWISEGKILKNYLFKYFKFKIIFLALNVTIPFATILINILFFPTF